MQQLEHIWKNGGHMKKKNAGSSRRPKVEALGYTEELTQDQIQAISNRDAIISCFGLYMLTSFSLLISIL